MPRANLLFLLLLVLMPVPGVAADIVSEQQQHEMSAIAARVSLKTLQASEAELDARIAKARADKAKAEGAESDAPARPVAAEGVSREAPARRQAIAADPLVRRIFRAGPGGPLRAMLSLEGGASLTVGEGAELPGGLVVSAITAEAVVVDGDGRSRPLAFGARETR